MTTIEILDPRSAIARARRWLGRHRRAWRRWRDGRLHPVRRRRAVQVLAELPPPRRILVLCLGNVCRSPYAEARLEERLLLAGRSTPVLSAGFIGGGRPADEVARQVALRRGVDLGHHSSAVVDEALIDHVDLILLVDPAHRLRLQAAVGRHQVPIVVLGDLDPAEGEARLIRDPWRQDEEVFERVFERLDRCIDALVEALAGTKTSDLPGH